MTVLISVGLLYLLLAYILPTLIGGLSFINKFKPTPKVDKLVEDTTIAPPVLNIPYEATNTATIKIKGYSQPSSKIQIYLGGELKTTADSSSDGSFVTPDVELSLGNNQISGKTVDDAGHTSLGSKPISIVYINQKPKLQINSPTNNQTTSDRKIQVTGITDPNISVSVNGQKTIVSDSGSFSQTIELKDGDNDLTIMASDQAGNITQQVVRVTFKT